MEKWKPENSEALKRNPQLSKSQAQKCDTGIHTYAMFSLNNQPIMCCKFCGWRKGGLEAITVNKAPLVQSKSTSKGTLTAKKTSDE